MNCFEVVAIKDHKAIHQSQLAFRRGDTIVVYETASTGWWRGELLGKRGLFPHTFVTYDKETLGPDPLGTNKQVMARAISPAQASPKKSLSPPVMAASPSINVQQQDLNDDFAEIDRIIMAHSPTHSVSPQPPKKKSITPPPRNIYNTISTASITISSTRPSSPPSTSTSPPTLVNGGVPTPLVAVMPSDLYKPLNKTGPIPRIPTSPSSEQIMLRSQMSAPSMSVIDEAETTRSGARHPQLSTEDTMDQYSGSQEFKYKTLPNSSEHSQSKTRKPLSSMFAQPSEDGRINLDECNLDVPYYLTRATLSYTKQSMDELTIKTDDLVLVYNSKDIDGDWWIGKVKNNYGLFPKNCVEIIKDMSPSSPGMSITSNGNTPLPSPTLKLSGNSVVTNHSTSSSNNMFLRPTTTTSMTSSYNGSLNRSTSHPALSPLTSPQNVTPASHTPSQHNTSPPVTFAKQQLPPSPNATLTKPAAGTTTSAMLDEEAVISQKIKNSFAMFKDREQMLEAIQGLAIKFVKQTNTLKQEVDATKKELEQERTMRLAFERELISLRSQLDQLKHS